MSETDGDRGELARGLLLESADALRLASDLAGDPKVRARLRRYADEVTLLSEQPVRGPSRVALQAQDHGGALL